MHPNHRSLTSPAITSSAEPFYRRVDTCDPEYPDRFWDLEEPPASFYISGTLEALNRPVLGVVGSRDVSLMAEAWMRKHLPQVARMSVIVSGGALGVDECAHRVSMECGEPTIVVLPSGLKRPYPSRWGLDRERVIGDGGAIISELTPDAPMRRSHFEKRNRLIAALSDVILIVEGQRRSGTSITARHAQILGRAIGVVPWFPGDPRGDLGLELLCQGAAIPVRDSADLMILMGRGAVSIRTRDTDRVTNEDQAKTRELVPNATDEKVTCD